MNSRQRLPNRREHRAVELTFRGQKYTVGFCRHADGRLAEVFIDAEKASSQVADDARDVAIALSFAFQHGATPEAVRDALTRDANGAPAGIGGAVLDILCGEGGR